MGPGMPDLGPGHFSPRDLSVRLLCPHAGELLQAQSLGPTDEQGWNGERGCMPQVGVGTGQAQELTILGGGLGCSGCLSCSCGLGCSCEETGTEKERYTQTKERYTQTSCWVPVRLCSEQGSCSKAGPPRTLPSSCLNRLKPRPHSLIPYPP